MFSIFSNACLLCNNDLENCEQKVCAECLEKFEFAEEPYCSHCGRPISCSTKNTLCTTCFNSDMQLDFGRSILNYNEYARNVVIKLKKLDENIAKWCAQLAYFKYANDFYD